ncbi:hypothetical protein Golax_020350, partial [Gossypium laxum]|nr:hypothetical protein [Gossypium laxum]
CLGEFLREFSVFERKANLGGFEPKKWPKNVLMETRERSRKNSRSRDIVSNLDGQVDHLEKYMVGVKETLEVIEGRPNKLDSIKVQLMDYVVGALRSNWEAMRKTLNATMDD